MILYKYYPCNEYTFRALSEMGLWCSPASNMNDPFDCLGQLELSIMSNEILKAKNYISSSVSLSSYLAPLLIIEDDISFCKIINDVRINLLSLLTFCSFSLDPFNILMWSHYADSHRGIVIELDLDNNGIHNPLFQEVKYKNSLSKFDIVNFIKLCNAINSKSDGYETGAFIKKYFAPYIKFLSIKTKDWKYEKEVRYWSIEKNHYKKYGYKNIKSIYFGLRCPQETKTLVKSILRGHGVSDDVYHDIKIETDPEIRLTI